MLKEICGVKSDDIKKYCADDCYPSRNQQQGGFVSPQFPIDQHEQAGNENECAEMKPRHGYPTQDRNEDGDPSFKCQPSGDTVENRGNVQQDIVLHITEEELTSGREENQKPRQNSFNRRPFKFAGEPENNCREHDRAQDVKREVNVAWIHGCPVGGMEVHCPLVDDAHERLVAETADKLIALVSPRCRLMDGAKKNGSIAKQMKFHREKKYSADQCTCQEQKAHGEWQ